MSGTELFQYALLALSIASLAIGLVFVLAGAAGVIRLPDFYTRLHAAGITDTLGAELIIVGLMLQAPDWQTAAKLALVGLLLFLTSPTATHAVANAAHRAGLEPKLARFRPKHPREVGDAAQRLAEKPGPTALAPNAKPAKPAKAKATEETPGQGDEA